MENFAWDTWQTSLNKLGLRLNKMTNKKSYQTLNAIRLLNNAYKHKDGIYFDGKKDHQKICASLKSEWTIDEGKAIEYSKIPIPELLSACQWYIGELLEKIVKSKTPFYPLHKKPS